MESAKSVDEIPSRCLDQERLANKTCRIFSADVFASVVFVSFVFFVVSSRPFRHDNVVRI